MCEIPDFINNLTNKLKNSAKEEIIFSHYYSKEKFHKYSILVPRTVFLLSGKKYYFITDENGSREVEINPGQYLYVKPFGLMAPSRLSKYEMIGIVYHHEFIRIIKITNERLSGLPPNKPDMFYHTEYPLSLCGKQLLKILNDSHKISQATAVSIHYAILNETIELLENKTNPTSQSWHAWSGIKNFIQENIFSSELSRSQVASEFNLTPSYVSQLFQKHDSMTFNACVTEERVNMAIKLLETTRKPLKEISALCGFSSPEYFIKVFKKLKGETPNVFRIQKNMETNII